MTESFAVTSAPSTATMGPTTQWSSTTSAKGWRTIRLARADGVGRPVGVAGDARDERAVAQDEPARLGVRRLLEHQRCAREDEAVQDDGRVRLHGQAELVGALEQRPRPVRGAERELAVCGVGLGSRRRDRRGGRVAAAVEDLHRAAACDRGERGTERCAAGDGHDGVHRLERRGAVVAAAPDGERRAVVEGREPRLAGGSCGGERDAAEHGVDGDVRVARRRRVRPGPGRGRVVGEVADPDVRGGDRVDVRSPSRPQAAAGARGRRARPGAPSRSAAAAAAERRSAPRGA